MLHEKQRFSVYFNAPALLIENVLEKPTNQDEFYDCSCACMKNEALGMVSYSNCVQRQCFQGALLDFKLV